MSTDGAPADTAAPDRPTGPTTIYVVIDVESSRGYEGYRPDGIFQDYRAELRACLQRVGLPHEWLRWGGIAVLGWAGRVWFEEADGLGRGQSRGRRTGAREVFGHPGLAGLHTLTEGLRRNPARSRPKVLYIVERSDDYIAELAGGLRTGPIASLSPMVLPIAVGEVDPGALGRLSTAPRIPPVRARDLVEARDVMIQRIVEHLTRRRIDLERVPPPGAAWTSSRSSNGAIVIDDVRPGPPADDVAESRASETLEEPPAVPAPDDGSGSPDGTPADAERVGARSVPERGWVGTVVPYAVGDPGRSATLVIPRPARPHRDRPDTVLDGVTVDGPGGIDRVTVRAASTRGLKHRHVGSVRQDSYAFRVTDDDRYLILAVADGVSSAAESEDGADHVAREGCAEVARQLIATAPDGVDWVAVTAHLNSGLAEICRVRAGSGDERLASDLLASTLALAVVELDRAPQELPVVLWTVGDTSAWVLRDGSRWEPQTKVKNAGVMIASSETPAFPLPPGFAPAPTRTVLGPGDAFVLMTDGIGDPLGSGTGAVGRFLAESWARPPGRLAFAGQVDFARRTHDDDRTALAVWPGPS